MVATTKQATSGQIPGRQIDFAGDELFLELDAFAEDTQLIEAVADCVDRQRWAGADYLHEHYHTSPQARQRVAVGELDTLLAGGADISDIVVQREISNCIAFNFANVQGAVMDAELCQHRRRLDRLVAARMRQLFVNAAALHVENSGCFWYPPGGFMGWHTNLRTPGWRFYISYADEPGKSFFRYRDPRSGEVITARDSRWNFRLFRITRQAPLWHAVCSDTQRFSIGYKITGRRA
jgi:hypothetical protein